MSEIILDAFEPTPGCLDPAPTNPKTPDPCQVAMTFHARGDSSTQFPVITFQRNQDSFVLASSRDLEIPLGLLKNGGFDEKSAPVQSLFLSSVGFFKWIERSYPSFKKKTGYSGASLLSEAHRMRNFTISGSITNPDAKQKQGNAALLRDILKDAEVPRNYFKTILNSLLGDDQKGLILPEMQPRMRWLLEMIDAYEKIQTAGPTLSEKDPLKPWIHSIALSLVVYLGTGDENPDEIQKFVDEAAVLLRKGNREGKPLYGSLVTSLKALESGDFFKNSKEALERLRRVQVLLQNAALEHRADLIGLTPKEALGKSLLFKIQDASTSGALIDLVRDEMKDAKMKEVWLKDFDHLKDLFNAFQPSFQWEEGQKIPPPGRVKVDVTRLKADLEKLFETHSIQNREYLIGSLALIRHFFGNTMKAAFVSTWVKDRYASIPLEISPEDRKALDKYSLSLERRIRRSLKQTNLYLPLGEAALCTVGLATGGAGLGVENRGLFVGGSTTAGIGCGALLTHYVIPTRNPYLSDTLGGLALGAAAFALSYFLGGSLTDPLGGRNPNTPGGGGLCMPPNGGCGP